MTYRELERALSKIAQWRLDHDNARIQFGVSNSTEDSRALWCKRMEEVDYHLDQEIKE